mgnify:CR=1 FL=1
MPLLGRMYDKVRAMYESGELDRILRYCKVKAEDFDDLKQEVAVLLLTKKEDIGELGKYTIGLVNRLYYGKHSSWYKKEGRWKKSRTGLQEARREISEE